MPESVLPMVVKKVFNAQALATSASSETVNYDLFQMANTGFFSLQPYVTGGGSVTFSYKTSNDGVGFSTSTFIATVTSATATSTISFTPSPCRYLRFKIKEGGTSSAAATAFVCFQ